MFSAWDHGKSLTHINHRNMVVKWGFMVVFMRFYGIDPLVMNDITMQRSTIFNGKIYYKTIAQSIQYPPVICYIAVENHHFQWVNPLFLWPFSKLPEGIGIFFFALGFSGIMILMGSDGS